jgi:hypothetical protein
VVNDSWRRTSHRHLLVGAGIVAAVAWLVPPFDLAVYPLVLLNTHVHELMHALAGVITGGEVHGISISSSGGGVTRTAGGWMPVIASAGYVGATLAGAALISAGGTERGARLGLSGLAIGLGVGMALWVRGDVVGLGFGIAWVACLIAVIRWLREDWLRFTCQFVGLSQCIASVEAFRVLWIVSRVPGAPSDAANMADSTMLPAPFWACVWGAFSLVMSWVHPGRGVSRIRKHERWVDNAEKKS